jgi:2-polyprenyl-3-methyl-5-hydroxy-6-metoxy-1,4-benzoquinol methylase
LARHLLFEIWRLKIKLISTAKQIDANKTYWVSQDKIKYACDGIDYRKPGYHKYHDRGKVVSGNWDLKKVLFSELPIYKAFVEHFHEKKDFKETYFYQQVLEEIDSGASPWGCNSKSDFDERLKTIDSLYEGIMKEGYKSQALLSDSESSRFSSFESVDEILVRIGRHGEILFEDGRHRLTIAKLLNIPKVPVKITVRHSAWYAFRKEILNHAKQHGNKVYHPLTHIDLANIPSAHGEQRYELIKPHLPQTGGDLLDIGANWGYFSHRLDDEGFNCYAVEDDLVNLYFLRKLRRAEDKNFEVIGKSIFDYYSNKTFRVVLALNIFHHFLKSLDLYHRLIDLLKRLDMEIMFFEPHLVNESQMVGSYANYNAEDFVAFILKHSKLNFSKYIGKAEDNRSIFMLYK